uniref:metallophosphoesterase family protein n=1 Tax=Alistipes sp. TaxID=1872444 RepID=UPI004056F984
MKWTKRSIEALVSSAIAVLFSSCDYFEEHPYATNIHGREAINTHAIARIEEALQGQNNFSFAVISDTQGHYDETEYAVRALNQIPELDFVIHCGDLTDFGMKKEFEFQRDILSHLQAPCVSLIGNHDCLATGEEVFYRIFGPTNDAFTAGNTRFICLNTNAMEYDYATPVPDLEFLDKEISELPAEIERVVYAMHVRPGELQFNNNVKELFQDMLRQSPGSPICLYGHEHTLRVDDLFNDGILYYQCPDISKCCYLLFRFTEKGYSYEACYF